MSSSTEYGGRLSSSFWFSRSSAVGALVRMLIGNDGALWAEASFRHVRVAPARQPVDLELVEILHRIEAAVHVAVERRIADAHLALVAGRQHHGAELVRDRHHDHAADARLGCSLPSMSGALPANSLASDVSKPSTGALDRHGVEADAERFGAGGRVLDALVRRVAVRQHDGMHAIRPQRIDGDRRDQRAESTPPERPSTHAREAVLVDVVAQAEHARMVGGAVALVDLGDLARRAPPARLRRASIP